MIKRIKILCFVCFTLLTVTRDCVGRSWSSLTQDYEKSQKSTKSNKEIKGKLIRLGDNNVIISVNSDTKITQLDDGSIKILNIDRPKWLMSAAKWGVVGYLLGKAAYEGMINIPFFPNMLCPKLENNARAICGFFGAASVFVSLDNLRMFFQNVI